MPRPGRPITQGRWRAIALSVVLHSGIVAAAVYGWFTWKHRPPPVETLAIEATVVDPKVLKGLPAAPKPPVPKPEPEPEPEPAPVEEQGPPKPDEAELERKKEEERLAQEKLEQEKKEQERVEAEKKEADRLEAEKQAAAEKARVEAEQKAAADKAAAEKKALEKKRADEAAAKKAAEEKARLAREADLRRMLEAEERGVALRGSEEASRWHAAIVARITRAWIPPPSLPAGVTCIVLVSQNPGGEVTAAQVQSCSVSDAALNAALKESVETAVKRASPLPAPPNPALFEPNLKLIFAP